MTRVACANGLLRQPAHQGPNLLVQPVQRRSRESFVTVLVKTQMTLLDGIQLPEGGILGRLRREGRIPTRAFSSRHQRMHARKAMSAPASCTQEGW